MPAGHVDIVARGQLGKAGGDYIGVVLRRYAQSLLACRRQGRPLAGQHQPAGRVADLARVIGAADFELARGVDPLRGRLGERGFGLRDIRSGDLTDPKPVAGRFQLPTQHRFVVLGDFDQCLVAHDIEIGLRHRLKHRRLDPERLGARGLYGVDCLPGLRLGATAPIQRLRDSKVDRPGGKAGKNGPRAPRGRTSPGKPSVAGKCHRRPPVRKRLRHLLVGRPEQRALGQQLGVVVVGIGECLGQGLRRSRRASKQRRDRSSGGGAAPRPQHNPAVLTPPRLRHPILRRQTRASGQIPVGVA